MALIVSENRSGAFRGVNRIELHRQIGASKRTFGHEGIIG
jgi:hypothetical protein